MTVRNAPLAFATGKELHPPILGTLEIHGGQVKRRERLHIRTFNNKNRLGLISKG